MISCTVAIIKWCIVCLFCRCPAVTGCFIYCLPMQEGCWQNLALKSVLVSNGWPFRRCYKGWIYTDKQRKSRNKSLSPGSKDSAWLITLLLRASSSWWAKFALHWMWPLVFLRYTVAWDRNNCSFWASLELWKHIPQGLCCILLVWYLGGFIWFG